MEEMAEALATLHWASKIDGNDIESVLAPATEQQASSCMSNVLGGYTMWMLDSDLCRDMSINEDGVRQAVKAYLSNDPFCPRPRNSRLWREFKE